MNIQIFGTSKCFDTKKADSAARAVGLENLVNPRHPDAVLLSYLASDQAKLDRLFEDPSLLRTPVVRNGRQATVGFCPEVWETWK